MHAIRKNRESSYIRKFFHRNRSLGFCCFLASWLYPIEVPRQAFQNLFRFARLARSRARFPKGCHRGGKRAAGFFAQKNDEHLKLGKRSKARGCIASSSFVRRGLSDVNAKRPFLSPSPIEQATAHPPATDQPVNGSTITELNSLNSKQARKFSLRALVQNVTLS